MSFRKNLNKLSILFPLISQLLFAQIKNDFVISENGQRPSSCININSNLFVAWDDFGNAISYQRFDSLGNEIGTKYQFNNTEAGVSPRQVVSGNYLISTWQDKIDTQIYYGYYNIVGNIYDYLVDLISITFKHHGSPEFKSDNPRYTPDICFLDDTTYFSVWHGLGAQFVGPNLLDLSQPGIYGRIGTVSGWPFGSEVWGPSATDSLSLVISDYGLRDDPDVTHSSPRVVCSKESPFFYVAWQDDHSGKERLYCRLFHKDGTPKDSSFIVNEDSSLTGLYYLSMAAAHNGDYVIVWSADSAGIPAVYWKWYSNAGSALTNSKKITNENDFVAIYASVDVSLDNSGKGVVTWEGKHESKIKIFAKQFDKDRSPIGNTFIVSTKKDITSNQIYPNVELRNNHIYFVWEEENTIWGNILDFDNPVAIKDHINNPIWFKLYQNYPNPFNPETTIEYSINKPGEVILTIHDIIGRKIRTLVNSFQKIGNYKVNFDAKNMSSGVYIYRLSLNSIITQKKMLLIQ